jgi:hypothetical protein
MFQSLWSTTLLNGAKVMSHPITKYGLWCQILVNVISITHVSTLLKSCHSSMSICYLG